MSDYEVDLAEQEADVEEASEAAEYDKCPGCGEEFGPADEVAYDKDGVECCPECGEPL